MKLSTFPPLKASSDKLLYLDVLRFVASAGIVYHHSHEFFVAPVSRATIAERTKGLALFVDLFFVISGFVIAYFYNDRVGGAAKFAQFMQRRIARLVPLHWITLCLTILTWWLVLKTGGSSAHIPSFRVESIAKTALLLHGIIPSSGHELSFNGQSWSVSAEMAMYVVFPVFALISRRWKLAPLIAGLLALAGIGVYFLNAGGLLSYDVTTLPAVIRALPSFLIGVGLYHQRDVLRRLPGLL